MAEELKYSLCYPDHSEIYYGERSINYTEAFRLFKSYNWKEELLKEIEYYSPSIDFIRLKDKQRIIFSGIGGEYLGDFQVSFIYPNNPNEKECFNENNYFEAEEIIAIVSTETAITLLQKFLVRNDQAILDIMSLAIKRIEELNQVEAQMGSTKPSNYEGSFNDIGQVFKGDLLIRIIGPIIAILFSVITISTTVSDDYYQLTILFGILASVFIFGSISYEFNRKKKQRHSGNSKSRK